MAHFIWLVMRNVQFSLMNNLHVKHLNCGHVIVCDALHYLLDNIFIRFGSKLYRQIVGIPMGTEGAPLEADLFFHYKKIGYNINVLQQTACLVVNFAFLFKCTLVGRTSDSMMVPT